MKSMHMYVWTREPFFYAVAQAEDVQTARTLLLDECGGTDGSCPERAEAAKWIREQTPAIWHGRNAEFALTDSAELRENELLCGRHGAALHKEGAGGAPKWECTCKGRFNKPAIWHADDDCPIHGEKLPLQRTLPDEQFKGAVVEPIGTESSDSGTWRCPYCNVDLRASEGIGDNYGNISHPACLAKVRAASPAGRAEEKEPSPGEMKR